MLVVLDEQEAVFEERRTDLIDSGAEQVYGWPRDGLRLALSLDGPSLTRDASRGSACPPGLYAFCARTTSSSGCSRKRYDTAGGRIDSVRNASSTRSVTSVRKRLLVAGVEHVGLEAEPDREVVALEHLVHQHDDRALQVDVAAGGRGFLDAPERSSVSLLHVDEEVEHDLHLGHAVVRARRDLREEEVVGDRHDAVGEGAELHRAQADHDHVTVLTAESDAVAHLEGPVEHDHHAGDEGRDKILHGEADGDRGAATDEASTCGADRGSSAARRAGSKK